MAASTPGYLAGQVAAVSQLLPVRAQRPSARQSPAWRPGGGDCRMRRSTTLEPNKSHLGLRGSDNFSGRVFPPISGIQGPRRLTAKFACLQKPATSWASWLVGILRPVIEAFVLAVLDAGHDLSLGRGVAFQLVGDQHTRRSSLLLQQ